MGGKTKIQEMREIIAQTSRQFSEEDRQSLLEWYRMEQTFRVAAKKINENSALVEDGQKLARQFEGVARMLENERNHWIGVKLAEMGYPKEFEVEIDFRTGLIKPHKEKGQNSKK